MYEIDFLPVGAGEKSGDAIALRFAARNPANDNQIVAIIDGGYSEVGSNLANHVDKYYGTSRADVVVSTHPDADHINGLCTVLEEMEVGELLLHLPANHGHDQDIWGDAVPKLRATAHRRGIPVTEPFTGLTRFNDALTVIGPTRDYYRDLLAQQAEESAAGKSLTAFIAETFAQVAKRAVSTLPLVETLGEDGVTTPCNNSSVITSWKIGGYRLLLTGDAGLPAMRQATDALVNNGHGPAAPLHFIQAPHHGSRRNLAPSLLDDLLGPRNAPFSSTTTAFVSASRDAPKHPSPKVTNALQRRGCRVFTSEEGAILHSALGIARDGWGLARPVAPMDEEADD